MPRALGQLEPVPQPRGKSRLYYDGTLGLLTTIESPDSVIVTLGHDGPLAMSQFWAGGTSARVDFAYNRSFLDSLVTVTVGGATDTASYSYDRDGLTTRAGRLLIHRRAVDGSVDSTQAGLLTQSQDYGTYGELANLRYAWNGTALFQQSLQRDALGRIVALQETAFGTDTLYGYRYDAAGRLYAVTTNGDTAARYGYDANGNRTRVVASGDTIAAEYDAQDRLLSVVTSGGDTTWYAYTGAGELQRAVTGPDTTRYTYDALGNLLRVVVSGDTIEYVIDGLNRRVGRKVNGAWTHRWLYADGLRPVAELDGTGALVARYVYGTRGHVPDYVVRGDSTFRLITDQLGSVRGVVNVATGAVVERIAYDPWGVPKPGGQAGPTTLGYAGGLRDTLTGLVRFGARDYDPLVGRWTNKDPIGFAGGDANLHAYAGGDPANIVDPDGTLPWDAELGKARPPSPVFDYIKSGRVMGYPPDAYIGDRPGTPGGVTSQTCPIPPSDVDVDVVKLYGRWWWLWGRVYITPPMTVVAPPLSVPIPIPPLPLPAPFGGIAPPLPGKQNYFRNRYPELYK